MDLKPTPEEISAARSVAFGATEDRIAEDWAKPVRDEIRQFAKHWARLSDDAKAQIESRLDQTGNWPDVGQAIRSVMEDFGSPVRSRPANLPGLREAVEALWNAYRLHVPDGGMGKLVQGAPPYPALRFVSAGVKAIWPERYDDKDERLLTEVDSQLRAIAYS